MSTPAPLAVEVVRRSSYTGEGFPNCIRIANTADRCLRGDTGMWSTIQKLGGIHRVSISEMIRYDREPWLLMPQLGRRFHRRGSVVLPLDDGLDNLVLEWVVPVGYDGVINQLVSMFTGVGFIEGSGDIRWRLRLNEWWVRDYANVVTSLGDVQQPFTLAGGGIRVKANQRVRMYVNIAVGAGAWLDPLGRIVVSTAGWFYPLR